MTRVGSPPSVLGRLLAAAGYRLESRTGAVVAVRQRDHRAVVIALAARSPSEVEPLFPPDAVHRTIVYDDDPGAEARADAGERGIEIVDPSTLGPSLGELLLPPPAESPSEADWAELAGPAVIAPDGPRTVRPRIGRAEAESLAGIDGTRYTLRLVPYFVAPYRVRSPSPHGGAGPILRRLVAVNATTRRGEVWKDGEREIVAGVDEPHQRLEPQLPEPLARPIALETIRRHHAVRVDHTEQHGGALVIETRRVAPAADDVRLGPFSLLYVPHWYAEASGGRVVLDAVTGRRVDGDDA